jgi:hypothetical protein
VAVKLGGRCKRSGSGKYGQCDQTEGHAPPHRNSKGHVWGPEEGETDAAPAQLLRQPPDTHVFLQFAGPVVVYDTRGLEQLVDRATVGKPIWREGDLVDSITLASGWFDVVAGKWTYRVPLTNVRSARR